jgi:hypothetical protein
MYGDGSDFFFEIKFEKFKIRNNKTFEDIIIEGNGTGSITDKRF